MNTFVITHDFNMNVIHFYYAYASGLSSSAQLHIVS
jgi:hypothetical protein